MAYAHCQDFPRINEVLKWGGSEDNYRDKGSMQLKIAPPLFPLHSSLPGPVFHKSVKGEHL